MTILTNIGKISPGSVVCCTDTTMNNRVSGMIVALVGLTVLLAACAVPPTPLAPTQLARPSPLLTAVPPKESPTLVVAGTKPPDAATTAVAGATSRGAELEASDPQSVALASGSLQLFEFFRFT